MSRQTFLATTGHEVARAWQRADGEWQVECFLASQDVRCLAAHRTHPEVVYAGTQGTRTGLPPDSGRVTHAGHGTVIRALAAGIPLVCPPMGHDQPENTARVVARGAGVRLSPKATVPQVRQAVQRVLADARFREAAQRLARAIAEEVEQSRAVGLLEELAAPTPRETVEPCAKTITAESDRRQMTYDSHRNHFS